MSGPTTPGAEETPDGVWGFVRAFLKFGLIAVPTLLAGVVAFGTVCTGTGATIYAFGGGRAVNGLELTVAYACGAFALLPAGGGTAAWLSRIIYRPAPPRGTTDDTPD